MYFVDGLKGLHVDHGLNILQISFDAPCRDHEFSILT